MLRQKFPGNSFGITFVRPSNVARTGSKTGSPLDGIEPIGDDGEVDPRHVRFADRLARYKRLKKRAIELVVERGLGIFMNRPTRDGRCSAAKSSAPFKSASRAS